MMSMTRILLMRSLDFVDALHSCGRDTVGGGLVPWGDLQHSELSRRDVLRVAAFYAAAGGPWCRS